MDVRGAGFVISGRVDGKYLSQLVAVAGEFREGDGLVAHLYETLVSENGRFMGFRSSKDFTEEARRDLQNRIHSLKSNYVNLGCASVGRLLDEMHEVLGSEDRARESLPACWERFARESAATVALLSHEIASLTRSKPGQDG